MFATLILVPVLTSDDDCFMRLFDDKHGVKFTQKPRSVLLALSVAYVSRSHLFVVAETKYLGR